MPVFQDLTGQRFNALTVIDRAEGIKTKEAHWKCICDCGKTTIVRSGSLKSGHTSSCGCLIKLILSLNATKHGYTKQGQKPSVEYTTWLAIRSRCNNPNPVGHQNYIGRGITVCKEWDSFEQFIADMGLRPSPQHSIDRIKNELGYSKENCRWATPKEQGRNKRTNVSLEYQGVIYGSKVELAEKFGVDTNLFNTRMCAGWSVEDALAPAKFNIKTGAVIVKLLKNIDTEEGTVYASAKEACLSLNLDSGSVSRVCSGKSKHVKGYVVRHIVKAGVKVGTFSDAYCLTQTVP